MVRPRASIFCNCSLDVRTNEATSSILRLPSMFFLAESIAPVTLTGFLAA
jgi:hypothetical protein